MTHRRIYILLTAMLFAVHFYATGRAPVSKPFRFKHHNIENGLPGETARCLYQDNEGFIWIGLESTGLTRYDGQSFDVFGYDHEDTTTISSNYIECITEDHSGSLWIGTNNGLSYLKKEATAFSRKPNFIRYKHKEGTNSIPDDNVSTVFTDHNHTVWVGTDKGLCRYIGSHQFETIVLNRNKQPKIRQIAEDRNGNLWIATNDGLYKLNESRTDYQHWNNLPAPSLNTLTIDHKNHVWVGTGKGAYIFDPSAEEFTLYNPENGRQFASAGVSCLYTTSDSAVWVGTYSYGIAVYEPQTNSSTVIDQDYLNPYGLLSNLVRDIREDKQGLVWIATKNEGLHIYDKRIETFPFITRHMEQSEGIQNKSVVCFEELHDGNILIGSKYGGISILNPLKQTLEPYITSGPLTDIFANNRVEAIKESENGEVWIGTVVGLNKYNPKTKQTVHYPFEHIQSIYEDVTGRIWVGASNGIFHFDKTTKTFVPFYNNGERLGCSFVGIYSGKNKDLWFASENYGLYHYYPMTGRIEHFEHVSNDTTALSSNMIRSVYEAADGKIWIGTKITGLNVYDPKTGIFQRIREKNNHYPNSVFAILQDASGLIWLSTTSGIYTYNQKTNHFETYTKEYGLQGDAFITGSSLMSTKGIMYFGGNNGLNFFDPLKIKKTQYTPEIRIKSVTNLKNDAPLSISKSNNAFAYDDYLSFEFALIDYGAPQRNVYSYRLLGLDRDWVVSGNVNFVSFANLKPGNYTLEVKGANLDQVWSKEVASYSFSIAPPWWDTRLAWIIYFILTALTLILAYRLITYQARKQRQLERLKYEKEQAEQLSQFKLNFFTNISHELRTPLTLLLPTIETITQKANGNQLQDLSNYALKHTKRMISLLDDLLEFRKIEYGQIKLKVQESNIIDTLHELFEEFSLAAGSKQLKLDFAPETSSIICHFDKDVIGKIVRNLLSNAYKYTRQGDEITLSVKVIEERKQTVLHKSKTRQKLQICVSDTGNGIDEKELKQIFNRFYRSTEQAHTQAGFGIGLDLVKSLADLHHGKVQATSTKGLGSHFCFEIPLHKAAYKNDEKVEVSTEAPFGSSGMGYQLEELHQQASTKTKSESTDLQPQTILIAEDDTDIQDLLIDLLSEDFNLEVFSNGKDALDHAKEKLPDLIISDIMMPEMNGIDFCHAAKTDEQMNRLPFVLLSAKAEVEDKVQGLETGADSYIPKPFYSRHLRAEIDSLLANRKRVEAYFKEKAPEQKVTAKPVDEFIASCMDIIREHMDEPEFGVQELAKEAGVSRTQLFRKTKELAECSPVELIYRLRLEKAADLLDDQSKTVAEIAYSTGFSSPSSFSTAFKKYFGKTPKEYAQSTSDISLKH